jgi:hypothetical protein
MKTVRISAVQARAVRLVQPEMIGKYREMAITWDEAAGTCELIEDDWRELNTMWHEPRSNGGSRPGSRAPRAPRKPCSNCRGL